MANLVTSGEILPLIQPLLKDVDVELISDSPTISLTRFTTTNRVALRAAVEDYATQMFITDGRYEYPSNPFDLVDVTGYVGTGSDVSGTSDGDWWANPENFGGGPEGLLIKHRRKSDEVYAWTYFPNDHSNGDSDDRGVNVGASIDHLKNYDADGNFDGSYHGPSNRFNGICVENCD